MKKCSKCGIEKQETEFYKTSGAWCKECCKDREKNRYYSNPDKAKERSRKWHHENRESNNERCRRYRKLPHAKEAQRKRGRRRDAVGRNRRIELISERGGSCEVCGYHRCNHSLHFHHLRDKKFALTGCNLKHLRYWLIAREEVSKCILVCANCHGEIHAGMFAITSRDDGGRLTYAYTMGS